MSRCFRYSTARKVEAVRRVVEDGQRVGDVAMELGISEGSLFFWVRRYRQFAQREAERHSGLLPALPRAANAPSRDAGSLVAWLRRLPQAAKSGKAARHGPLLASNR